VGFWSIWSIFGEISGVRISNFTAQHRRNSPSIEGETTLLLRVLQDTAEKPLSAIR
jgi:hypothetical protein